MAIVSIIWERGANLGEAKLSLSGCAWIQWLTTGLMQNTWTQVCVFCETQDRTLKPSFFYMFLFAKRYAGECAAKYLLPTPIRHPYSRPVLVLSQKHVGCSFQLWLRLLNNQSVKLLNHILTSWILDSAQVDCLWLCGLFRSAVEKDLWLKFSLLPRIRASSRRRTC